MTVRSLEEQAPIGSESIWKRHGIPPLHNVLHLLSLIDLMNQIRRVINQPHGGFAWDTDAA